jgi:hypothetical protein
LPDGTVAREVYHRWTTGGRIVLACTRLLLAALLALLLGPIAPPSARVHAVPPMDAVGAAAQLRHSFGLRADPEYVQRSVTDAEMFSISDWGVPLREAEAEDLYESRTARGRTSRNASRWHLLSVRVVDRSLIALQELQVAVGEGRHALRAAGADVSSVSIHVASNRVEVGLADYTEQAAEVVMSAFPGVDVYAGSHSELDACTDIESCGPG